MVEQYAWVADPKRLAAKRKAQGLTYRGLAAAIGSPTSWSALRRLEIPVERGGRHTLSVQRAMQIAAALNIEPHELYDYFRFRRVAQVA